MAPGVRAASPGLQATNVSGWSLLQEPPHQGLQGSPSGPAVMCPKITVRLPWAGDGTMRRNLLRWHHKSLFLSRILDTYRFRAVHWISLLPQARYEAEVFGATSLCSYYVQTPALNAGAENDGG